MKLIAAGECAGVDVGGVGMQYYMRHSPREDAVSAVRAFQYCKGRAALENVARCQCDGWSESHLCQRCAINKCVGSDGDEEWQVRDGCEGSASKKCLWSDGDEEWQVQDGCEGSASKKCFWSDGDEVWQVRDGGKFVAIFECLLSDRFEGEGFVLLLGGNHYKRFTIIECTTLYCAEGGRQF